MAIDLQDPLNLKSLPNVVTDDYMLIWAPVDLLHTVIPNKFFHLAIFSTPYPGLRGSEIDPVEYLDNWLPLRLEKIFPLMKDKAVIMQNIMFPRTEDGWYDWSIFHIPYIYNAYGWKMIDIHPWDKINAPPSGNPDRHDRNEFEFCFTFSRSLDYTYHPYRKSYAKGTVVKSGSGNMRQTDVAGSLSGGHDKLHPEGATQGNIYRFSPTGGEEQHRPRVKAGVFPMALAERAILQYSNPGNNVGDFFCGSGTVVKMAVKHGRFGIGCDIDRDNINTAASWLASDETL